MTRKKNVEFNWKTLHKHTGMELLDEIEPVSCFIDTGILALNYICSGKFYGGGIPAGKIIEIFGDSATGKSLLGTNILRGVQTIGGVPVMLDAERAISKDFAIRASKIDPKRFFVIEADTLETAFAKIYASIKKIREIVPQEHPIVIVYDSIAASPSEREFAETTIDMETATKTQIKEAGAGADKPGERAKICSKELRKLPAFCKDHNASVVFINQLRQKIGVLYGPDVAPGGGGRALEYYSSLRLHIKANRIPKDKKGNVMGVNVKIKNEKNRCFKPFVEAEGMHLLFDSGINPFGGLLDLLLKIDRIEGGAGGNYKVCDSYTDGKEVKFKASRQRGDVPYETLLACPALVDAENPEQIQYYIDLCKNAIDSVNNEIDTEEKTEKEAGWRNA